MNKCPSLILQCEDSLEGILTAIYDAFVEKNKMPDFQDGDIRIAIGENHTLSLFARQIEVVTDLDKAQKTLFSIQKKISYLAYKKVMSALCHYDLERGNVVLGFLIKGFPMGAKVLEDMADAYVMRVIELSRKVDNESHLFCGFVRFFDLGKFLYSEIEPKCHVLPQIMEHFADRYPNEHYVIYDKKRQVALIHLAFGDSFFVSGDQWNIDLSQHEDYFERLWSQYFKTIAIEERYNPCCQNNLIPKWYRKNMVEFQE
ncbi:MAG: TIGR03915 family putative DNA repair protein [Agathobacter sp.]|nr:TIGR03915 family putative DNA repair protein [Agathobacter sp.]